MKKNITTILICVLMAVAAFYIGRISLQKHYERKIEEIVNIYYDKSDESDVAPDYDGKIVAIDLCDVYGKKVDIDSISGKRNVCARFSATGCRPCIDTLTDALQAFVESNPDWHVNLLIDNIYQRDMYVLSKEFGPSFSLYSTGASMGDTGSDISPVMFRVTPEGKIFRHFICSPDYPERTYDYVSTIGL